MRLFVLDEIALVGEALVTMLVRTRERSTLRMTGFMGLQIGPRDKHSAACSAQKFPFAGMDAHVTVQAVLIAERPAAQRT